jgi:hypothetical protein
MPAISTAARFAALYAVLAHEDGDYWVQQDTDAVTKGKPGRKGAAAARHVATQALAVAAANRAFGLRLS